MSADLPTLAIVGRTNEGKSSVVSALTENDRIPIDHAPGTTTHNQALSCESEGQGHLTIVDTPGFEDAEGALEWMEGQGGDASLRPSVLRRFIQVHRGGPEFREECELLQPIVEGGAGIIYVVDGSHPFRREYEKEMEILRWTGQPRMALINPKAGRQHVEAWERALGQYFSIVRIFDAHHAPLKSRLVVLEAFRELQGTPEGRAQVDRAIAAIQEQQRRRPMQVREILTETLLTVCSLRIEENYHQTPPTKEELSQALVGKLRERWEDHLRSVERLYRHHLDQREGNDLLLQPFLKDIFSSDTWELFGLPKKTLAMMGAMVGVGSGAPIGGIIDAHTGGASFLAGTVLGALIGVGVGIFSSLFASEQAGKMKFMGQSLGQPVARFGPILHPGLAWVVLDLALVHHSVISQRSHALRSPLELKGSGKKGMVEKLNPGLREKLEKCFSEMRKAADRPDRWPQVREELRDLMGELPLDGTD